MKPKKHFTDNKKSSKKKSTLPQSKSEKDSSLRCHHSAALAG